MFFFSEDLEAFCHCLELWPSASVLAHSFAAFQKFHYDLSAIYGQQVCQQTCFQLLLSRPPRLLRIQLPLLQLLRELAFNRNCSRFVPHTLHQSLPAFIAPFCAENMKAITPLSGSEGKDIPGQGALATHSNLPVTFPLSC